MEERLPFTEKISQEHRERIFIETTDDDELKWHRDHEDRLVSPLHKTDWMVQLDNELPAPLIENEEIFIPEGVWHRLIKGTGELKVKIKFV